MDDLYMGVIHRQLLDGGWCKIVVVTGARVAAEAERLFQAYAYQIGGIVEDRTPELVSSLTALHLGQVAQITAERE